jgi:hypothetical protein
MPRRLNQGSRGTWGFVIDSENNQNDIQKPVNVSRNDAVLRNTFIQNGMSGTGAEFSGAGIGATIKNLLDQAKTKSRQAGKIVDVLTGETATSLRNMLPSSDENARAGFAGEKHAILKLPNGKFGVANYMGPGTQLEKRLRRGDPPRTQSDKVAQAHDSRYAVARSQKDVASADRKMISKLKDLQKRRLDSNFNIQMGMRPIQAKLHSESLGLVKPGSIASFGDVKDRSLVEGKLQELEQEGFGLPGDKLKMKLLRSMRKPKSGKGLGLPGGGLGLPGGGSAKQLASLITGKMFPMLLKKLGLFGSGLKLGGSGMKKIDSMLHMKLLRAMNDGSSRKSATVGSKNTMLGTGKKLAALKKGAIEVSKTLLPILIKLALKKFEGGSRKSRNQLLRGHETLVPKLASGIFTFLKNALSRKKMSGSGMCGTGFFDSFKKGFMSVINPALKVAKTLAPFAPLLL